MPQVGADGDVVDITLHTVKVQNFDKTIVSIPTWRLMSESFKNWRGMQASGGRRIKRSLFIDASGVRFLRDDEEQKLSQVHLLTDYMTRKQAELRQHRQQVVENIPLDPLVVGPRRGAGEAIDFQRNTLGLSLIHISEPTRPY